MKRLAPNLLFILVAQSLACAAGQPNTQTPTDDVEALDADDVKPLDVDPDAIADGQLPPLDVPAVDLPVSPDAPVDLGTADVTDAPLADLPSSDAGDAGDVVDATDVPAVDACTAMCSGVCTNTDADPRNCGGCGIDCAVRPGVDPARVRCTRGQCDLTGACVLGRANCSGNPIDGCESVVTTAARCGTCANTCADPTPVCGMVAGAPSGFGCTSGCSSPNPSRCGTSCVNTDTDPRNCGACGTVCAGGLNATAACVAGRCTVSCITGYGDCDGMPSNGCETLTRSNPAHCGMCGFVCATAANATTLCSVGACALTCATGFANCDGAYANGCEADTRTSLSNCGVCGNACLTRPNSTAACVSGACAVTCATGFGNCDGLVTNGCEADLRASATSCGACGMRCATAANAAAACADGICGITCLAGYGNCNANGLDGCEASFQTDPRNCGACGTTCQGGTNATATCTAARCGLTCNAGYGNCDADLTNGCEVSTATSLLHCGACGAACNAPSNASAACTAGRCVVTCDAGYTLSGATCVRTPPRPVTPPAFSVSTSRRPTFRVALPAGQDGASVDVCGNRTCTSVATTLTFSGSRGVSTIDLAPGTYYWRIRGTVGGAVATLPSPVSQFAVSAPVSTTVGAAWGSVFDANGDGYTELAVGMPSLNRIQVYTGSTAFYSSVSYTIITGTTSYGSAVAGAGDTNADGYADLVVGAPTGNTVYVYQGGASGLGTAPTQTLTVAGTTQFGASVANAGDYNGDGFADVIVGVPGSNRAYFYLGSTAGLSTTPVMLSPAAGNFGVAVSGAGDVNADGLSDFLVGTDGGGAAYLYFGSSTALVAAPTMIVAPSGASGFGRAVAGAGDVNGDGFPDVIVGAYNQGAAYVFHGSAIGVASTPSTTLTVPGGAVQFGYAVDGLGDVNGDGYGDVIVGAPLSERAYVFYGSSTGASPTPSLTFTLTTSTAFGRTVVGLGDVNRDTYFDFAVGAPTRLQVNVYRGLSTPGLYTSLTGSTSFGSALTGL